MRRVKATEVTTENFLIIIKIKARNTRSISAPTSRQNSDWCSCIIVGASGATLSGATVGSTGGGGSGGSAGELLPGCLQGMFMRCPAKKGEWLGCLKAVHV